MKTENIWNQYNDALYFFILKRTKDKEVTNDIFQNVFFKIHLNISQLKDKKKLNAWVFQIARNEINNYFKKEAIYVDKFNLLEAPTPQISQHFCCFDKFINELPQTYKNVIELIYIEGLKQKEVATKLNISLENVKIRVKRGKDILKKKFNECCKYEFNDAGKLIGEPNCPTCN